MDQTQYTDGRKKNRINVHLVSSCPVLTLIEYKKMYKNIRYYILWKIHKWYGILDREKWYKNQLEPITEAKKTRILWKFSIQIDRKI